MQPNTVPSRSTAADPAAPVLARALALVEDLKLDAVRRYKQEHPGALAVGILPVYAPRPLFEALNVLPVGMYGGGDHVDIIRGDSFYQSYICHIPRSVIELGLGGALDALDGMVFPSTCDVIRNLNGMWKMLFPNRWVTYLDLPQNFEPVMGGKFYVHDMQRMANELVKVGARPLTRENLLVAVAHENRRRALLADLDALRRNTPWKVRASEAYLLVRAGCLMDATQHADMLQEFLGLVDQRELRRYDNMRVIVVGAFCEQPPLGLIRTLEKSGCDLVDDDFQLGLKMIEGPIPSSKADLPGINCAPLNPEEPLDAIALAFLYAGTATSTRYIGKDVKGRALVERVKRGRADGVIFAAPSFCNPALLDQPMMEKALNDAGIPHTSFKYSENSGQFQSIREQAGAFSDSVKLWGSAA